VSRGGKRAGTPGTRYSNRTDLPGSVKGPAGQVMTPGKPLPIATATGQPYGAAGAQRAAQSALPMSAPVDGVSPPGGSPTPGVPSPPPPASVPSFGLPDGALQPGELPPLHAPTDRPDEHLMTGVDAGPGAGSEALGLPPTQVGAPLQTTAQFLAHLASQPGAPAEIVALANTAGRSG
jgi:hypothetical protein